jgi:signal peptidase II
MFFMRRPLFFSISLAIFFLDQWAKRLIESRLLLYDSIPIIGGFLDITHARNTGVAFSLLAGNSSPWIPRLLTTASLLTLLVILFVLLRYSKISRALQTGLLLVLGGAAGNLCDRIRYGFVVDFLDVYVGSYHWPTFNIADSAITVGIGFLLLDQWGPKTSPAKN